MPGRGYREGMGETMVTDHALSHICSIWLFSKQQVSWTTKDQEYKHVTSSEQRASM